MMSALRRVAEKLLWPFYLLLEIWQWLREEPPIAKSFERTGRLPYSSRIEGTFYRWHNRDNLFSGKEFCKTFEDGPWKWSAAQRYAGEHLNCGHYFSLAAEGATAEAEFYGMETVKTHRMLTVTADFESVLDLTYEENLRAVVAALVENSE